MFPPITFFLPRYNRNKIYLNLKIPPWNHFFTFERPSPPPSDDPPQSIASM